MSDLTDLEDLLKSLPGYEVVTSGMKTAALGGSLIPDSEGRWPHHEDYVTTHDVYFAALSLLGFLQAQPLVTSANSEGTSVTVTAPDWSALLAYYRSMSRIVNATGNQILQKVLIPEGPHVHRTDMSGRGTRYGDVDTDVG